jgi:hypothetical protein
MSPERAWTLFYWSGPREFVWESRWIEYLCSALSVDVHDAAPTDETASHALVVAGIDRESPKSSDLIRSLARRRGRVCQGLVHLSDEYYRAPRDGLYVECDVAIRVGYFQERLPAHVLTVPLGPSSEFMRVCSAEGIGATPRPPGQRRWTWCFMGQVVGKPTRSAMMARMQGIPNAYCYVGMTDWTKLNSGVPKADYARVLADSVIAPCPRGNSNVGDESADCFRTWEAAAMGAIPVVDSDYYRRAYGAPFPIVAADWHDAVAVLEPLLRDEAHAREVQRAVCDWWSRLRDALPRVVADHVRAWTAGEPRSS